MTMKKGSIIYRRCQELALIIVNLGYKTINIGDLKYLIAKHVGSDPRTIRGYIRYLNEFGFLQQLKPTTYLILKTWVTKQATLMEVIKE